MQSMVDAPNAAESLSYASVRFATFVSIVVVVGAALFLTVVAPRMRNGAGDSDESREMQRRLRLLGLGASFALLALALARLALQRAVLAEMLGGSDPIPVGDILAGPWGRGLALQCIGAIAGVVAFGSRLTSRGSEVARTLALVMVVSPALSGHASGEEHSLVPVIADSLHVLAAGAWVGLLASLGIVALPVMARRGGESASSQVSDMLGAFSPVALGSAAVLAITGAYAAWLHLAGWSTLWTTQYGQALVWKLVFVGVMLIIGAVNWKRNGPHVGAPKGITRLMRTAWLELVIAALVLFMTAVLVAHGSPADMVE